MYIECKNVDKIEDWNSSQIHWGEQEFSISLLNMSLSFLSIHHPKHQAGEEKELSHTWSIIFIQQSIFFLPDIHS